MQELVPPPLPVTRAATSLQFTGDRRRFLALITRGGLLEFVTLGFYRFWLTTDMRRHLWLHTSVDGDAAEYTGYGKELLIGFLVALAILLPIYLAFFLLTIEAERLQAFGSVPLLVFTYVFGQFAVYRARRYRLTRTVWRGVHFWMGGSGWNYALRASLWNVLVSITLGLALPWREAALERYKMRNSHYGSLSGEFAGTGSELFKRGWWLWLLTLFSFWIPIAWPFLLGLYRSITWRWWVSGLRFGDVRFQSSLTLDCFFGLYWKVIGWGLLILCAFIGVFSVASAALGASNDTSGAEDLAALLENPKTLITLGVTYLLCGVAAGIVIRLYLMRDFWQRVIDSTTVYNIDAANNVAVRGELASAVGEGLADSLDVGGF